MRERERDKKEQGRDGDGKWGWRRGGRQTEDSGDGKGALGKDSVNYITKTQQ